jgi:CheY-like chemotaxis protein
MSVSATNARILIVDDDKSLRSLLSLVLTEEGYTVTEAKSGEDCLRLFPQLQPDLVLLDAVMPDMDGFDCCEQLRLLPNGQRIPILMITFLDDQESIERAFQVGATDYIPKPIPWPVLFQRLQRLMTFSQAIAQFDQIQHHLQDLQRWHHFNQSLLATAHRVLEPTDLYEQILQDSQHYFQVTLAIFACPQKHLFMVKSRDNLEFYRSIADFFPQNFSYYPESFEILPKTDLSDLTEAQTHFLASFQAQTAIAIPLSLSSTPLAYLFFLEPHPRRWRDVEIERFQSLGQFWALLLR